MEITLIKNETLDETALRNRISRDYLDKNADEILDYLETDEGLTYLENRICELVGELDMQIDDFTYQTILDYLQENL